MSTVYSKLSTTNDNYSRSNSRMQSHQNKQIYSELFSDNDENLHSKKIEYDLDLPKVIKNAVNIIKEKSNPYSSLFQNRKSNIKNPCGICQKSVNKNQHAIYCTVCLRWMHRKYSGTSLKEYEYLNEENDDIPWQCLLCDIDEMAFKFPFSHLSKIELNDLNGLDFLLSCNYFQIMNSGRNFHIFQLWIILTMFNQLIQIILIFWIFKS